MILGKSALIVSLYGLNLSFKMLFWECLGEKTPTFFSEGPFFCLLQMKYLLECVYSNKPPSPWKIAGCTPENILKTRLLWNRFLHKQPSRGILRKRCSENMQQIYKRIPLPKCDFNKIAKQFYWNHISAWMSSCKLSAYFQNIFS